MIIACLWQASFQVKCVPAGNHIHLHNVASLEEEVWILEDPVIKTASHMKPAK